MNEFDRTIITDKYADPSLIGDNLHTPTDPSPLTYPPMVELLYERELMDYLGRLVTNEAPADVSENLRGMINLHLHSNHAITMKTNYDAYQMLMLSDVSHDPIIHHIIEKAKLSMASPSELLLLNLSTNIPSVELKKLTHPFGHRQEYLGPMESEVSNAVKEMGGRMYDADEVVVDRSILPYEYNTNGFIVIDRRLVGEVDNLRIKERKTYAINVSSPDFDPKIRDKIKRISNHLPHGEWMRQVLEVTGFSEYVDMALSAKESAPYLHGLSTLFYSYNLDQKQPKTKEDREKAQSEHVRHLVQKAINNL